MHRGGAFRANFLYYCSQGAEESMKLADKGKIVRSSGSKDMSEEGSEVAEQQEANFLIMIGSVCSQTSLQ